MPRVSEFHGIVIGMFYNDHAPPHFHAACGGREALVEIETLDFLEGVLPPSAARLVRRWASMHRYELSRNWERARHGLALDRIEGLE